MRDKIGKYTKVSFHTLALAPLLAFVFLFVSCGSQVDCSHWDQSATPAIKAFVSDGDFHSYLSCMADKLNAEKDSNSSSYPSQSSANGSSGQENANITNNQESDVDEGGIVKNIGDYLLILRKGRLYAASVARVGSPIQSDSIRVARDESLNEGVWYDEMLVKGNNIYVIGFRYVALSDNPMSGAVEVNSFKLTNGSLTRLQTVFLESNDYYSWRNYASRLVEGNLVLYMPHYGLRFSDEHYVPNIPSYLAFENGNFHKTSPILRGNDVFMSLESPKYPTLHTSVICQLPLNGEVQCQAKSVLATWFREHYVSATHVFLWSDKAVYAMELNSFQISAHRVEGFPIDQFSFKHDGNLLNVLTSNYQSDQKTLQLYQLPLSQFNGYGNQELGSVVKNIIGLDTDSYPLVNRFVDQQALVGISSYNHGYNFNKGRLLVVPLSGGTTSEIELDGPAVRIEPLSGVGALVVTQTLTQDSAHLTLKTIRFASGPMVASSISIDGLQGEWRSQGFFFKPSNQGGNLGLPIINPDQGNHWWGDGTANIAFLSTTNNGNLASLGFVTSSPASTGSCETSCIDWYGNTRPIFLQDRVFALMGSELQEVALTNSIASPTGTRLLLTR